VLITNLEKSKRFNFWCPVAAAGLRPFNPSQSAPVSPSYLKRSSPFRTPDWRWQKAQLVLIDQRLASKLRYEGDPYSAAAVSFLQRWHDCRDEYDHLCMEEEWPYLYQAHSAFHDSERLIRWELEARLLANDDTEKISKRLSMERDVIDWYEALFFNVRDRLENKGWVAHKILGEQLHFGMNERECQLLWKFYGYMGGSIVLDAVIDRHFEPTKPTSPAQMRAFSYDEQRDAASLKAMTAMRTMPVNSYTQEKIIEITQRFREIELAADKSGGSQDMIVDNIKRCLESLPWTISDSKEMVSSRDYRKVVGQLSEEVVAYDSMAGELRSDMFVEVTAGMSVQRREVLERIKQARFPDQPTEVKSLDYLEEEEEEEEERQGGRNGPYESA
jgi:hypothetical protein